MDDAEECGARSAVNIPRGVPMARTIAVRASRDNFVAIHGLVSLKWEENEQKTAADSATNYDDLSSNCSEESMISDGR